MNQKGLIAALVVVVVILIGTTVYFAIINNASTPVTPIPKVVQQQVQTPASATPQQALPVSDETVGWKTYTNTKYGFEFKYPNDHKVLSEGLVTSDTAPVFKMEKFIIVPPKEDWNSRQDSMTIHISSDSKILSRFDGWEKSEDKTINNITFTGFNNPGMCDPYGYSIKYGKYYYSFNIICEGIDKQFEKIISTFKFTK